MINIFDYMPKANHQFTYLDLKVKKKESNTIEFVQAKPTIDASSKSSAV